MFEYEYRYEQMVKGFKGLGLMRLMPDVLDAF